MGILIHQANSLTIFNYQINNFYGIKGYVAIAAGKRSSKK